MYPILVKTWKQLKLRNSIPFFKKTIVSRLYIWIWSFWLTFTALQWIKTNFEISQFEDFCKRSEYVIHVKICKWLKLLNSVPFIKKTLANHVYFRIWSSWLSFTVLQWMKTNFKISQFSRFLLTSENAIQVKIWKWLKLLNSVPFIKKTLLIKFTFQFDHFDWFWQIKFTFQFDHFDWLSQLYSEWRKTPKLVSFQIFC